MPKVFERLGKLMIRLVIMLCICLLSSQSYADYLSPKSASECYNTNPYPQTALIEQISKRWSICWNKNWSHSERTRKTSYSCGVYVKACGDIENRRCELEKSRKKVKAACLAKWDKIKLAKKISKQNQERINSRQVSQDTKTNNQILEEATRTAFSKKGLKANGKRIIKIQSDAKKYGKRVAKFLNIKPPSKYSAYGLSDKVSKIGTRFILSLNQQSQENLELALRKFDKNFLENSEYNTSNPVPTSSQVSASYDQLEAILKHSDRIVNLEYDLPLGTASVVNTPQGQFLNDIAEAALSGDITNFDNLLEGYFQHLDNYVNLEGEDSSDGISSIDLDNIQNLQQLASTAIISDARTKAIANARERKRKRKRKAARKKRKNKSAASCLRYVMTVESYTEYGLMGIYLNGCNSYVSCNVRGYTRRNRPNPNLVNGIGEFQIPLTDQPNCWFS